MARNKWGRKEEGGGGEGTDNYNDLNNKPKINGHTLSGNKTPAQLGLQTTIADLDDIRQGAEDGTEALSKTLNPVSKTSGMTQAVGKDEDGMLWTTPGGGTSFEDLGYELFSEAETYAAGDVVIYGGSLYRFTAAHTGAWTGTDATATSVEELIKEGGGGNGHSPYIGQNDNWYEWDNETQQYVDTGTKAQGPQGLQGEQGPQGLQGEQGTQGNTGSSVDYPFELVNNLNTNDATKALSAAMGFKLNFPFESSTLIDEFETIGQGTQLSDYSWTVDNGVYTLNKGASGASSNYYFWLGTIPTLNPAKTYIVNFDYEFEKEVYAANPVWFMARNGADGSADSCGGFNMTGIGLHHGKFTIGRNDALYFIFSSKYVPSNSYLKISNIQVSEKVKSLPEILSVIPDVQESYDIIKDDINILDSVVVDKESLEGSLTWQQGSNRSYATLVPGENLSLVVTTNFKGKSRFGFFLNSGSYHIHMKIIKDRLPWSNNGDWGFGKTLDDTFVGAGWRVKNGVLDIITYVKESGYYYLSANSFEVGTVLAFSDARIKRLTPKINKTPIGIKKYNYDGAKISIEKSVSWEKYMDLSHQSGLPTAQGSCVFGDYFFQGYNNGGYIAIFDLVNKTRIATVATGLTASSNIHFNTLCFGAEKYDDADTFPLLYACSGYVVEGTNGKVYVFRIVVNDNTYSLSLVQTISLPFNKWTEFAIDTEYKYAYVQVSDIIYRFNLPKLADGNVSLSEDGDYFISKSSYRKNYTASDQGHLFYNGRIYYSSGVPTWMRTKGETGLYLCVLDPLLGRFDNVISLIDLELYNGTDDNTFEPEGVFVWRGNLYIPYRGFIIKMYFE